MILMIASSVCSGTTFFTLTIVVDIFFFPSQLVLCQCILKNAFGSRTYPAGNASVLGQNGEQACRGSIKQMAGGYLMLLGSINWA